MAQPYTPAWRAAGDHADIINARLLSFERTDAAGIESDRLTLVVDTTGLDGLPRDGAKIRWSEGWLEEGLIDKGTFIVNQRRASLFPNTVTLTAAAAPFQAEDDTEFKQRRSASYGPVTLGDLFRQLTERHGFSPRVAPDLDEILLDHVDQTDETDMSFLTRLARRYDAVTKPVDTLYVLARRGQVKTISGQDLPALTLSVPMDNRPAVQGFISASLEDRSRNKSSGVITTWWDDTAAIEHQVKLGAEPYKRIRQRYQSEDEARAGAEGEMRRLSRQDQQIRIDMPGTPRAVAEGLITLDETWPGFMRGTRSIDRVTARGDRRGGYRCSLTATWPDK